MQSMMRWFRFIWWAVVWLALDRHSLASLSLPKTVGRMIQTPCRPVNHSQLRNMCLSPRPIDRNSVLHLYCRRRCQHHRRHCCHSTQEQVMTCYCSLCCHSLEWLSCFSEASSFVHYCLLAPICRFSLLYLQLSPIFSPCKNKNETKIRINSCSNLFKATNGLFFFGSPVPDFVDSLHNSLDVILGSAPGLCTYWSWHFFHSNAYFLPHFANSSSLVKHQNFR